MFYKPVTIIFIPYTERIVTSNQQMDVHWWRQFSSKTRKRIVWKFTPIISKTSRKKDITNNWNSI